MNVDLARHCISDSSVDRAHTAKLEKCSEDQRHLRLIDTFNVRTGEIRADVTVL